MTAASRAGSSVEIRTSIWAARWNTSSGWNARKRLVEGYTIADIQLDQVGAAIQCVLEVGPRASAQTVDDKHFGAGGDERSHDVRTMKPAPSRHHRSHDPQARGSFATGFSRRRCPRTTADRPPDDQGIQRKGQGSLMTKARRLARLFFRARFLAAIVAVLLSALVLLPDRLGLDRWTPFAQVVVFRPGFAAATVVLSVLMLASRRAWPSAVALIVVGVLATVAVLPRTVPGPEPATGGRELSVLLFNVYDGRADAAVLAQVIRDRRPDLVALPEAGQDFRARIDHELAGQGYRSWSSRGPGEPDIDSVTALAAPSAGAVHVELGAQTLFPYLELSGGGLGRLKFVAFHAAAPVSGRMAQWRHDLGLLPSWCSSSGHAIVAGDLNATLDQSVLRDNATGCSDAAARRGQGLVGTWPSTWPHWLAVPIDHVLATAGIDTRDVDVLDIPGSDHRAIFARLRLPE